MSGDQADVVLQSARRVQRLHGEVERVAPIHGVTIGRLDDRTSWSIQFKTGATDDEIAAAEAVIQAFDPDAPTPEDVDVERDRRIAAYLSSATGKPVTVADVPKVLADGAREATRLLNKEVRKKQQLSESEQARAGQLEGMDEAVATLENAAEVMKAASMGVPPTDYTDDSHWGGDQRRSGGTELVSAGNQTERPGNR